MARKTNDIVPTPANQGKLVKPDFMMGEATGTDQLKQYVAPPRIKIVQKMTDEKVTEQFPPGSVLVVPGFHPLSMWPKEKTDPLVSFTFTPLFFFEEWATLNPLSLKGKAPMMLERTFDPKHPIVAKARDPQRRVEPHPEFRNEMVKHTEFLNFIVYLDELESVAVMTFAAGEHVTGRNFAGLITLRKAPIFGCRFVAQPGLRSNDKGSWFGLDIRNADDPWVTKEQYDANKLLFEEFDKLHKERLIRVDHEDPEIEPIPEGVTEM